METLLKTSNEAEARELFRLCSQAQWNYDKAKKELKDSQWRKQVRQVLYRPFDVRWTVYNSNVAVHRRDRVMRHMIVGPNIGVAVSRSVKGEPWRDALASNLIVEFGVVATRPGNAAPLFPLYLYPPEWDSTATLLGEHHKTNSGRRTNLNPDVTAKIEQLIGLRFIGDGSGDLDSTFGPVDVFNYIYAILYSDGFRARYADFLKMDFPRLPLAATPELFRTLAGVGGELVALHIMESSKLDKHITRAVGSPNPKVEKVSWLGQTVWLDKAQTTGFAGVTETVWNFHIGGYQVCEKWLKERKGLTLSKDDIAHYHKIVVALSETIRLMAEIDRVIAAHGGWPAAFVTSPDKVPA